MPTIVRTMSELQAAIAAMSDAECADTERAAHDGGADPRLLLVRALIARRRDDRPAAIRLVGEAASRAGLAGAEYHHLHAQWLGDSGRTDEAIEAWDRAIDIRPDYEAAQDGLGKALARRGRSDQRYPVTVITPTVGTHYLQR